MFKVRNGLTRADFRDRDRLVRREAELRGYRAPAGAMYQGRQHLAVVDGVRLLRDRGVKTDLLVISAGYGVIPEDREIVPYNVTFSAMGPEQIGAWARFLDIPAALRRAVAPYPRVVFLLGERYLSAVEPPINARTGQRLFFFARPGEDRLGQNRVHHVPAGTAQLRDYPGASGISLKGEMFLALARGIAARPESLEQLSGEAAGTAIMAALQEGRS
jgi:hypothetical protein